MRKIIVLCGLSLVSAIALFFYGCGGGGYGGGGYGGGGSMGGGGGTGIATTITISPTTASVTVSGMMTFTAVSKDANGNTLTGVPLVWSSSDPSVATINSSGVATGVTVGTTSITASVTYNSGGGYGNPGMGTTYTSNMATLKVTTMSDVMGVVATGHALMGAVVTLKDSTGRSQTALSDATGHFQLSVAGMTGPFLLRADDGRGHRLFGAAAAPGNANIDTVTDLMLRAWYAGHGTTAEQAFTNMGAHPAADAGAMQAMNQVFGRALHDALDIEGIDAGKFDLFATPFAPDGTGFDAVLDNSRTVTGQVLQLQDGLTGRVTEIGFTAGGIGLTTRGTGSPEVQTQRMELP